MMTRQKKNQQPAQPEVQDPAEAEDQRFEQMETRLTKAFDVKFAKLQKVMEKIAASRDESPKTPAAKKRAGPQGNNTHDTRNKALRSHCR